MAIDLSKLDRSEWMSVLGSGDWEIVLPSPYPALRISATWRHERQVDAAKAFVRWVLRRDPLDAAVDAYQGLLGEACSGPAEVDRRLAQYGSLLEWARDVAPASLFSPSVLWADDPLTYEDILEIGFDIEIDLLITAELQPVLGPNLRSLLFGATLFDFALVSFTGHLHI